MKNYISKASGEANTPIVVANGENLGKAYNYFHKDIHALTQFGNQRDIYALVALRPVVFETHDKNAYEAIKLDDYSQTYIEKRSEMLYYVINPQSQTSGDAIYFKDVATNIETYTRQSGVVYTSKVLFGSEQGDNDTVLNGSSGDDFIFGMNGNDALEGNTGNDYLEGGKGVDSLRGGAGNDTYYFQRGDFLDTVYDKSGDDTLLFGKNITKDDLIVQYDGNDLIITLKDSSQSDSITLKDWYTKENRIEYFEFADGTLLDEENILDLMTTPEADSIQGTENDNTLEGTEGDDILIGSKGNDTLEGGEGNDLLMGGDGYDTYIVDAGDTVIDSDGKGRVIFQGNLLSGASMELGETHYYSQEDHGTYFLTSNGFQFVADSGATLTIETPVATSETILPSITGGTTIATHHTGTGVTLEDFSSPLVLDLDNDGMTSMPLYATQTYFDMDGDGFRERTSWTESTDGLLTLDLNNDGKVTNGSELFGNNTKLANGTNAKDGFEALSQYDLNKDNVIDAKDSIYSHLKVWIDSNSDGISTADELKTLQELNITSINLNATETSTSEAYNTISDTSTFTQDGQTKTINDVWFYQDKSDTTYDYTTPIKESVALLPTIEGSGRVKDLRDAMNDDSVLEAKVTNLLNNASSMSFANFSTAFKDMVARWTGTDTISATATRGTQSVLNHNYSNASPIYVKEIYAYARDVAILEAFAGKSFSMVADGVTTTDVIGTQASVAMNEAYKELQYSQMIAFLSDALYGESLSKDELITHLQTTLSTTPNDALSTLLLSTMVYRYGLDTLESFDDTLLLDTTFKTALSANGISYNINALGEVVGTYGDVQVGSSGNDTITSAGYLYGGDGNDTLYGSSGKDVIDGGVGDDVIYGRDNNDVLRGGEGNDYIVAGSSTSDNNYGHDILEGGKENDTLIGTGRNSTYVYNYGDGYDTIIDSGNIGATTDVLSLRGIVLSDLNFRTSGNDVIIDILDVNDATVVNGSITIKNGVGRGAIETLQLEEGTYNLNGLLNTQVINGQRVYKVEDNFGSLTLSSLNNIGLVFGEGISSDDIIVQASSSSNNLVIALKEEGKSFSQLSNKLTLTNWFSDASRISTFTFNDGMVLSANDVVNLQGTENVDTVHLLDSTSDVTLSLGLGNDVAQTLGGNDTVDGGEGNDTLKGGAGNDLLKGGIGADALYGESGNDTLEGGSDNDTLQGGEGNDTYIFGKGDGKDIIIDASGENALSFGAGITASDLVFKKNGNDLIFALQEDGKSFEELSDVVTLQNWYSQSGSIKTFLFADGTSYNEEDIYTQLLQEGILYGTVNNDTIKGTDNADTIYAGAGDDTITGGLGADNLQGGAGSDTYVFNRGDGSDTITDDYHYAPYYWNTNYTIQGNGGNDTLSFGEGITADDIIVQASANSNDLIVALKEEGKSFDELSDKIVLKDWFSVNNRVETFTFSDGTILHVNDIVNLQGTENDDTVHLVDSTSNVTLSMQGGDDVVQTSGDNDTIDGGAGDDILKGGAGDDTYLYSKNGGTDTIIDISGNDTLSFGEGITSDDIIVQASVNSNDLTVALKEEGKNFDELTDKIVLKDWFNSNNRIESFTFNDGTTLHVNDIVALQQVTSGDDYLYYTEANNIIEGKEGNDTLVGGDGDDVYLFGRGDGVDTIIDIAKDNDSISFKPGISIGDIDVQVIGTQMIIALKEEGKSFDELNDKLILESVGSNDYGIEWLSFEDGSKIDPRSLIAQYNGTEGYDTINLAYLQAINPNVTADTGVIVDAKESYDTVILGNGNNTITNAENITVGNGNNAISVLSGDGYEQISVGNGNNTIEFTSDLDDVTINVGNGDNTITQLQYGDDDAEMNYRGAVLARASLASSSMEGEDTNNDRNSYQKSNNYTYINLGIGSNQVTLGDSNDSVYYYGGDDRITGSNIIDVGAGSNTVGIHSDIDQTIITGSSTFMENSGHSDITSGHGNNSITIQNGQDASLYLGNGNNTLTVNDSSINNAYFDGGDNTIKITNERLDGITHSFTFNGGENNITVEGKGTLLSINGSGDNTVHLSDGNDALAIGVNNYKTPSVYAKAMGMNNSNSNRIDAGVGNDMIASLGFSADSYVIEKGDGVDRLYDMLGYDSIVFGKGITASNISVSVLKETVGDTGVENYSNYISSKMLPSSDMELISLVIRYGDNLEDQIILTDWYNTGRVESFIFSDGTVLSDHEIVSLIGSSASELALGTEGDNTLEAHNGDDTVSAGEGNDTYVFGKGDGHDTFVETEGFDTVRFKEGISKSDLILQSSGNNLVISIKEAGKTYSELQDSIVISNWFDESGRIERFSFSDGSTMELDDIFGAIDGSGHVFYGTPESDMLEGSDDAEIIMALASNDVINGNGGNDLLFGQEGDDTLNGGVGDDILYGGEGNDTYIIERNSGDDTVFDSTGIDKLLFAEGISVDDIGVSFDGNDLLVNVEGTSLRLRDWYKEANRIESFSFSDGTTLGVNDILALMISDSDDYARTLEEGSTLETLEGNDTLLGGSGNDTLLGGTGNDMYRVSFKGNDVILDSSGVDRLSFDASISPTNLKMTWQQGTHDLILSSDQFPNSSVTLQGWYDQANRIETFTFSDGTVWNVADIIDHLGTDSADVYNGLQEEDNIINARGGDDIISTYAGNDTLNGGSGYDSLDAGSGNDILNGETGNDLLLGGAGDDTYLFEGNFGHDVIIDEADEHSDGGSADKIVFGKGIDASNLVFKTDLNDTNLYIGIKEGDTPFEKLSNTITITNWYDPKNRIETILFNDGTEVSIQQLVTAALSSSGEMIKAYEEGGILIGTPQKDYLVGGSGRDEIYGRDDDDTILGNAGDDILVGEAGNDVLNGGLGNDIYGFGYGNGADVIHDLATESQSNFAFVVGEDGISRWQTVSTKYSVDAGNDTLYFAAGISSNDLVVSNSGKDLIIQLRGTTEQVTIKDFYESNTRIENFAFSDGTILSATAIETLLFTKGNDAVVFKDNLNHITAGLNGDDVITTSSGNDILEGGLGNDTLNGGLGDDVYVFGKGSGKDSIVEVVGDEWWQTNGGNDQILLTNGLTQNDIIVKKVGNDIVIGIKENGKSFDELSDTITIKNAFTDAGRIESIAFEDGSNVLVSNVVIINQSPILTAAEVGVTLNDVRESTGTIAVSDPDGDTLIYSISTQTEHGAFNIDENGTWEYKANRGYIGNDSAIIKVDDGNGGVVEQTLNFTLEVSAPIIATTSLTLLEDTSLTDIIKVTNPIGGVLTYEVVDTTDYGSFGFNENGSFIYTPSSNYNGKDNLSIKVTNEYGLSTTQTIELNIVPINDIPTVENKELSYLLKNVRILSGNVIASDIDGDTLTYGISTQASHGKISINEKGEWTYKADGSYNGVDSAVILVDDGNGGMVEQTLQFTIQGYIYEGENLVIDTTDKETLVMSAIHKDDLSFQRSGGDLVITVLNTQTITLKNYFNDIHAGVEKLATADGDINLTRDVINESMYGGYISLDSQDHLISGNEYVNWLIGNTGNDILLGSGGNDYISGSNGNDLFIGGDGDDNLHGNKGSDIIYADNGNDQIYAGDGNDVLIGGNGNDILFGENGDDMISGGMGNDTIYSGEGNDVIKGGRGNDFINGSYGSDTYLFNLGDGNDTIVDTSAYGSSDTDKIFFGEGITQENLQILRDNCDLVFKVNETDSIRVKYWFSGDQRNTLEQIAFSDGTTLNANDVNTLAITKGTEGSDWLFGINTLGDNLYGMGGNDSIYSYGGDDFLSGGVDNDFLEGGSGSDSYFFNKGDGKDTINEWASWNSSEVDKIKFGNDITNNDISFILRGTNLLIQYGQNDTIKVANTYNANAPIERMELSNGSYLSNNDISLIIQEMSAYASEKGISLNSNDIVRNNADLMQIVSSSWHNA